MWISFAQYFLCTAKFKMKLLRVQFWLQFKQISNSRNSVQWKMLVNAFRFASSWLTNSNLPLYVSMKMQSQNFESFRKNEYPPFNSEQNFQWVFFLLNGNFNWNFELNILFTYQMKLNCVKCNWQICRSLTKLNFTANEIKFSNDFEIDGFFGDVFFVAIGRHLKSHIWGKNTTICLFN